MYPGLMPGGMPGGGGGDGQLPGGLSSDGYLDRRLRPLDSEHYSAAGLLPYRSREGKIEVLLPKERPWNSFTQGYDPVAWNVFGGKRVPRQERSVETTAVRCFLETVGQVDGAPDHEMLYGMMQSSFVVWYPTGKFALVMVEVPGDKLADLPERYTAMKSEAGASEEFRILPMGIKKWNKQIDEICWVAATELLAESEDKVVSDLLGCMVKIDSMTEFLDGTTDPQKTLPEGGAIQAPPRQENGFKGGGKGGKNNWEKGGGKGRGGGKGGGKGGKGGKGFKAGGGQGFTPGGKGGMPMMYQPGPSKGMPMMSPMFYPNYDQNYDQNSAEMQRQMYGEQLYVLVQPMAPSPYLAQKITGMLLELPQNELMLNLTNQEELGRRVQEALDVLREDGVA